MIAADKPAQRPADAQLLVIDAQGEITRRARTALADLLRDGDLLVANDAATLPASLSGTHLRTRASIEVRLAGCASFDLGRGLFQAIVFGAGDHRTRTEDRAPPPQLRPADLLQLGPLRARVEAVLDHPRFVAVRFLARADLVWSGIATHGRPIQYAHLPEPLELWDVWTSFAARPAAYEPPSAGFVLDWKLLLALQAKGVRFATLTHAAGISSTGDAALDRRLPLDEPYEIPIATVRAIEATLERRGRIVALGTTVVRALEHAACTHSPLRAGTGLATQRLDASWHLRIVNVVISGTHERGTSHYELLRAFVTDSTLERADALLNAHAFRTHEFGDSVFIERSRPRGESAIAACNQALTSAA